MARYWSALLLSIISIVVIANTAWAQATGFSPRIAEADARLFESRFAEADTLYGEVIDDEQADAAERAVALAHRCYSLLVRFRTDEAVADCRAAIEVAPDEPEGYIYLTRALDWQGNVAEAMETGQKAVALAPESALAHSFLGEAYVDAGATADSENEIARSVELAGGDSPYDGAIFRNLAVVRLLANDHEGFVEAADKATFLAPDFAPFRDEFGSYYGQIGRIDLYADAVVALADIYNRTGDAANELAALGYAADALYALGRLDETKTVYTRLATLQEEAGNRVEALRWPNCPLPPRKCSPSHNFSAARR